MKNYINLGEINTDNTSGFSYEWYFNLTSDTLNSNLFTFSFNLTNGNEFKGTDKIVLTNIDELNVTKTINVNSIDLNKWYHLILTINSSGLADIFVNGIKQQSSLDFGNVKSGSRSHCYFGAGPNTINKYTSNEDANYSEMKVRFMRIYNNRIITNMEALDLYKLRNDKNIFKPYQNDLIEKIDNVTNPSYSYDFRNNANESIYDYMNNEAIIYNGNAYSNVGTGAILLNGQYQSDYLTLKPEITIFDDTKIGTNKGSSIEFYAYMMDDNISLDYRSYIFSFTQDDENGNILKEFSLFESNNGLCIDISDNNTNILTYDVNNPDYNVKKEDYVNKWVQFVLVFKESSISLNHSELRIYITDESYWNNNKNIRELGNYKNLTNFDQQQIISNLYNKSYISLTHPNKIINEQILTSKEMNLKYFRIWNNHSLSVDEIKELYISKDNENLYVYNNIFAPKDNIEFKKALLLYYVNPDYSFKTFGKINNWDTKNVTNMDYMIELLAGNFSGDAGTDLSDNWNIHIEDFYNEFYIDTLNINNSNGYNFNEDISNWNTSNVTSMKYMFYNANEFNIDITRRIIKPYENYNSSLFNTNEEYYAWDMSNVKYMESMFENASKYDKRIHINSLNPDNALNMFKNATNFKILNQNSYGFNNGDPTNDFFNKYSLETNETLRTAINDYLQDKQQAENVYGPIYNWDLYNITDTSKLFKNTSFNEDISNWDVSNVINMNEMFYGASEFNQSLNSWRTSSVLIFSSCFKNANKFNNSINWDVSNAKYFNSMFENAVVFNKNIRNWNVSNALEFNNMFKNADNMISTYSAPITPSPEYKWFFIH